MGRDKAEQRILVVSMLATLAVGATGIGFGILSGSQSIIFDGLFSGVDASMTLLALFVARLIARQTSERFQMGFWHIEPMVLALNSGLIMVLTAYAFVNAVTVILAGGRVLAFDWAVLYATVVMAICFGMYVWERRANTDIGSDFIALDVKGWLMSGLITSALFIAFAGGWLLQGSAYEHWTPYVDPLVLAVLAIFILPVPLRVFLKAVSDIFLVAPRDLDTEVRTVTDRIVAEKGFLDSRTYVARAGRSRMVEIHFIAPPDMPLGTAGDLDLIREAISAALGGPDRNRWLTVTITGDARWAD